MAPRWNDGEKAKRLRRFCFRRGISGCEQIFEPFKDIDLWSEQRRLAGRCCANAEARSFPGGRVRLSAAGYASLSKVHGWPLLGSGIRKRGKARTVRLPARIFALSQRREGQKISRDTFHHRRWRYARRAASCAQDVRVATSQHRLRPSDSFALRHKIGTLRRAADQQNHRRGHGYSQLPFLAVESSASGRLAKFTSQRDLRRGASNGLANGVAEASGCSD